MPRFRVTAGQFGRRTEGDEFEGHEGLAEEWPDRLDVVDASDTDDDGDDGEDDTDESPLTALNGVGESMAENLREAGYDTASDVRHADPSELAALDGIGESLAETLTETGSEE